MKIFNFYRNEDEIPINPELPEGAIKIEYFQHKILNCFFVFIQFLLIVIIYFFSLVRGVAYTNIFNFRLSDHKIIMVLVVYILVLICFLIFTFIFRLFFNKGIIAYVLFKPISFKIHFLFWKKTSRNRLINVLLLYHIVAWIFFLIVSLKTFSSPLPLICYLLSLCLLIWTIFLGTTFFDIRSQVPKNSQIISSGKFTYWFIEKE